LTIFANFSASSLAIFKLHVFYIKYECVVTNKGGLNGQKYISNDSPEFSWLRDADGTIKTDANGAKIRHPDFPNNYMEHIRGNMGYADIIFVSSHDNVREALNKVSIPHVLVYPAAEMKDEMVKRYIDRGSPQSFVDLIKKNWDNFINSMKNDPCPNKVELKPGQYLKDVLGDIVKMMEKLPETMPKIKLK